MVSMRTAEVCHPLKSHSSESFKIPLILPTQASENKYMLRIQTTLFLSCQEDGGHSDLPTQPTSLRNKEHILLRETGKEKFSQNYKNISPGFKTHKEVVKGAYIDKKCPFIGNVSIRGQILPGVVTKMKMQRTTVVCWDYLHNRFEKHHKNMSVHLSPFQGCTN